MRGCVRPETCAEMSLQVRISRSKGRMTTAASLPLLIFACSTWRTNAYSGGFLHLSNHPSQRSTLFMKRPLILRNPFAMRNYYFVRTAPPPMPSAMGRVGGLLTRIPQSQLLSSSRSAATRMSAASDVDAAIDLKTEIRRTVKGVQEKYG